LVQTNVNFDEARFIHMLQQASGYTQQLKDKLKAAGERGRPGFWVAAVNLVATAPVISHHAYLTGLCASSMVCVGLV
jgi:hypothetical protein